MKSAKRRFGPQHIARLTQGVLDPVTTKRGFAKIDLIAAWDEVVGARYASVTQPEKMQWRRDRFEGAVLTVRVSGSSALFLQHETEQFIARINSFLGFAAVSEIRMVQLPIAGRKGPMAVERPDIADEAKNAIASELAGFVDGGLKEALARLGTEIARDRLARP